ncbi:hypothetical protein BH11PSE8_BH11PSE8_34120 [soil metagenome]
MTPPAEDDRTLIDPNAGIRKPMPAGPSATPSAGNALPVGSVLGEFELTRVAGEGGFSIVYLAWDHSLQRKVALKEFLPSSLAMRAGGSLVRVKSERHRETFELGLRSFINEARLLAQFDHPSLVKVYRFWEANGTAYMVMPFYEGQTVKEVLRSRRGPPDETWLRNLLSPLTEALMVIHAEKCYHRDIAADNVILLAGTNRPLLLDFGAARRLIGDATQQLTAILKPGYAPIEQYAEVPGMKQGPWTDVYALGALMYGAILGKIPPAAVARMVQDTMVPIRQAAYGRYNDGFLSAIDRALVVLPEGRTRSIEAFRAELGLGGHAAEQERAAPIAPEIKTVMIPRGDLRAKASPAPGRAPAVSAASKPASAPTASGGGRIAVLAGSGLLLIALVGGGAYWMLASRSAVPAVDPQALVASGAAVVPTVAVVAVSPPPNAATTSATNLPPAALPTTVESTQPSPPTTRTSRPSGRFDPRREFDQILKAQSPGFGVEASSVKPVLKIDRDKLVFNVASARDGYVYVLQLGADANVRELFPNKGATANRIRKGQTLTLPTSDWMFVLDTGEPAGREYVLAIVSDQPRDFTAMGGLSEGGFPLFPIGEQAAALARPPGNSPYAGKPVCAGGATCADEYGAALFFYDVIR